MKVSRYWLNSAAASLPQAARPLPLGEASCGTNAKVREFFHKLASSAVLAAVDRQRCAGHEGSVVTGELAVTVKESVQLLVKLPEVPLTVIVAGPVVAVPLAVSVNTLVLVVGLVPNEAVTPVGKPDADKFTFPLKPF